MQKPHHKSADHTQVDSYHDFRALLVSRFSAQADSTIELINQDLRNNSDLDASTQEKEKQLVGELVNLLVSDFINAFSQKGMEQPLGAEHINIDFSVFKSELSESQFLQVYQCARKWVMEMLRSEAKSIIRELKPEYVLNLLHELYLYEEALFTSITGAGNGKIVTGSDNPGLSATGYRNAMDLLHSDSPPLVTKIDDYSLSGSNTAIVLWDAQLTEVQQAANHLHTLFSDTDMLTIPHNGGSMFCWTKAPYKQLIDNLNNSKFPRDWKLAVGEAGDGAAGFRESYEQSITAQKIANIAGERSDQITYFSDVSALGFLIQSRSQAEQWVSATLGDLAAPTQDAERLRETLYAYWRCDKNVAKTAERLFLHRNTVNYRIAQARKIMPERSWSNSLNVILALTYMHYIPFDTTEH